MQPAHCQSGGGGDGVLFGDPDVEDPVGELRGEALQPGGVQHRGGQRDHLRALPGDSQQLVSHHPGP